MERNTNMSFSLRTYYQDPINLNAEITSQDGEVIMHRKNIMLCFLNYLKKKCNTVEDDISTFK